jgi:hypothetical protein
MLACTCPEEKRQAILSYLRSNLASGNQYHKAKCIADALGLSSREVGANLRKLSEEGVPDLHIEPWSVTRATTWRVARSDSMMADD